MNTYLAHDAKPGLTVFDIRLGLTVLDVVESADHPGADVLVEDLARRTARARDGYAAREVLAHPSFPTLATGKTAQNCNDLVRSCALDAGAIPEELYRDLSMALDRSETVVNCSLTSETASDRAAR